MYYAAPVWIVVRNSLALLVTTSARWELAAVKICSATLATLARITDIGQQ